MSKDVLIVASKDFIVDIQNFLFQLGYKTKTADTEEEILKKAEDTAIKGIRVRSLHLTKSLCL